MYWYHISDQNINKKEIRGEIKELDRREKIRKK